MSYKYDPVNKILVKTKDKNYSENQILSFLKQKGYKVETKEAKQLAGSVSEYMSNAPSDYTLEKWLRDTKLNYPEMLKKLATHDSKTIDYSYNDAARTFAYLDKEVQRDLKNYAATIQKADTSKKCEELNQIIRDLMEDYMDEYLEISNQVSNYSHKMREQAQTLFSSLMSQCFKKYNELKREGK